MIKGGFYTDNVLLVSQKQQGTRFIIKAEQTRLNTRAASRQAKRDQNRKWKIKYAEREERNE